MRKTIPDAERFASKVDRNGPIPENCPELGPCHVWKDSKTAQGYGQITIGSRTDGTKRTEMAHRFAFFLAEGRWPDHCALHHCDNRACVKAKSDERGPSHLFEFTSSLRFAAKVDLNGPVPPHRPELGPCHVWTGAVKGGSLKHGRYAAFGAHYAHRVAYEAAHGPIPAGLEIDHLCRNHLCVRPSHLEPVTRRENLRRGNGALAQRRRAKARTQCPQGHPYDQENTIRGKHQRKCRACNREWNRLRRERMRCG